MPWGESEDTAVRIYIFLAVLVPPSLFWSVGLAVEVKLLIRLMKLGYILVMPGPAGPREICYHGKQEGHFLITHLTRACCV